jgi:hypothetical protein
MKHKRVQPALAVPALAMGLFFAVLPVQAQEPASHRRAPDFKTSLIARRSTPVYPEVTKLRQTLGSVSQYEFLSARHLFRGRTCQIDNSYRAFQDVFRRFEDRIVPSA